MALTGHLPNPRSVVTLVISRLVIDGRARSSKRSSLRLSFLVRGEITPADSELKVAPFRSQTKLPARLGLWAILAK